MKSIISAVRSGLLIKALDIIKVSDDQLSIRDVNNLIKLSMKFDAVDIFCWLTEKSIHRFDLIKTEPLYIFQNGYRNDLPDMTKLGMELTDPSNNENLAFRYACSTNNPKSAKILLSDKRVNPSASDCQALMNASRNGMTEIVKMILLDPRVDPSFDIMSMAIERAIRYGHTEIVQILLADKTIYPQSYFITLAIENGYIDIVKMLLPACSVFSPCNDALYRAALCNQLEIFKILLCDERIDLSTHDNYAVKWAYYNDHYEIFEKLLNDTRVRSADLSDVFLIANGRGKEKQIEILRAAGFELLSDIEILRNKKNKKHLSKD